MKALFLPAIVVACLLSFSASAADKTSPTIEDLWEIIQKQQAEIDALKSQQQDTAKQAADADEKAEAAVVAIEESGSATSAKASWADKTTIGGYGELHYNNFDNDDIDDEIDFHRFVLFFGHEFTDRLRLISEFELEHALSGDGKNGEIELEQAYIEYDIFDNLQTKGGLFLMPVGILNETHEPVTFYGVERNDVENIIIPATWWEAGAGLNGYYENGISWDLALTSGLAIPTSEDNAFRIRSGRQKVSEAIANDLAYTGRLKYTGIQGLELAGTLNYQSDASQKSGDGLDDGLLFETHAIYQTGPFQLRALYAGWDFDGDAVKAAGEDRQSGWYIEPSIRPWQSLGFYARYEDLDGARTRDKFKQWEIGANYWPYEDVVLKVDYRDRNVDTVDVAAKSVDFSAFDLGIGYQF
ncbi:MAG: porin [Pseudomonadota bacterium]